jgi:hypothetical protein
MIEESPTSNIVGQSDKLYTSGTVRMYRIVSLFLSVLFAVVGLIFLLAPNAVLSAFNGISRNLGMVETPPQGPGIFPVLAVAYMYLVALLAFLMYIHPEEKAFPLILSNAKVSSSALSLGMIVFQGTYLVYITNFIVDGVIAAGVIVLWRMMRKVVP